MVTTVTAPPILDHQPCGRSLAVTPMANPNIPWWAPTGGPASRPEVDVEPRSCRASAMRADRRQGVSVTRLGGKSGACFEIIISSLQSIPRRKIQIPLADGLVKLYPMSAYLEETRRSNQLTRRLHRRTKTILQQCRKRRLYWVTLTYHMAAKIPHTILISAGRKP